MFCSSCGSKMEDSRCVGCDVKIQKLPAAWMMLLSGIGDIIVGVVFILIGLIAIGDIIEFSSFVWVVFGGILVGSGVNNIDTKLQLC